MLLLQILDEGTITDSQGRKVDFRVRLFLALRCKILNLLHRIQLSALQVTSVRLRFGMTGSAK